MNMPIYRRETNGIKHLTPTAKKATVKFTDKQIEFMGRDAYEAILERSKAEQGEVVDHTALAEATELVALLGPMFNDAKIARQELAIKALEAGEPAAKVRAEANVNWSIFRGWTLDNPRIPEEAQKDIYESERAETLEKIEEDPVKFNNQRVALLRLQSTKGKGKTATAAATKLTEYNQLVETLNLALSEFKNAHGVPYQHGEDKDTDALIARRNYFFLDGVQAV